ncbi:MAG: Eco57I restriction-modification methylase domain-containing protein [Chloroflexi bacterium]|nr:Eco57I restriction-modification methylase domain-containing protein [Chloroflexota bacterium]
MNPAIAPSWRDLWAAFCSDRDAEELAECDWLQRVSTFLPSEDMLPTQVSDGLAQMYSGHADESHRKKRGQFFTPPRIARFMASLSAPPNSDCWVIDPGAGTGTLIAAVAEHVAQNGNCRQWRATVYETDPALWPALALSLGYTRHWLGKRNINFQFQIEAEDFILGNASQLRPTPMFDAGRTLLAPDLIIANPPYFKLAKHDPRVALLPEVVYGQPNIYALFMAAAAKLLTPSGQLIFITPRSFCSGPYFRQFRKWFFHNLALQRLHLFESRTDAFARDKVLQENIILAAIKDPPANFLYVSNSFGADDVQDATPRLVPVSQVIDLSSSEAVLTIPSDANAQVHEIFGKWQSRLSTFGVTISTGPIVPFRTESLVSDATGIATAPVLWLQHVQRMNVAWPLVRFAKPQQIRIGSDTRMLLVPNTNYVLVRRFSPKEENSRITAAPYLAGSLPSEFLGIENHLNYLYRPGGTLTQAETIGLAAFLNSRWVENYFRLSSGNTQVSATELRNLPLPPLDGIRGIGERLLASDGIAPVALINQVVGAELGLSLESSNVNGGHMSKIEEARDLLNRLGLPPAQRNEIAALTLLALAGLTENDAWNLAQRRSIRIHDMILFVEQNYHKRYAENTRETFRRQVLHQFEQARLVDLNPDDPTLPTNSPRTHYAISQALLPVVRNYGTKAGQRYLDKFRTEQGTLLEIYQQRRARHLIPLRDESGHEYLLSPGKHNALQVAVIEQFAPRFAPEAKVLYLGDTALKTLIMDTDGLDKIGFPANKHNKLPDIVLHVPKKKWLFLIEVVTAHGPVSPKRHHELERILATSPLGRIYVSVFPDFKEYLRHARNVAWETEIWIAEAPDHLIHYNGDKFLGPPSSRKT